MFAAVSCLVMFPVSAPPVVLGQTVLQLQPDKPPAKPAEPQKPAKTDPAGKPAPPGDPDDDPDADSPTPPKSQTKTDPPNTDPSKTATAKRKPRPDTVWADETLGCTLRYPGDWEEVSEDLLRKFKPNGRDKLIASTQLPFVTGFQPAGRPEFGPPCVFIQRHTRDSLFYKRFSPVFDNRLTSEIMSRMMERLAGDMEKQGATEVPAFDKERKRLTFPLGRPDGDDDNPRGMLAMSFGKDGALGVFCLSTKDEYEDMRPVFARVIDSVEFDAADETSPPAAPPAGSPGFSGYSSFDQFDPSVQRLILSGLIGGIVVVGLVVLRSLFAGGGRSPQP